MPCGRRLIPSFSVNSIPASLKTRTILSIVPVRACLSPRSMFKMLSLLMTCSPIMYQRQVESLGFVAQAVAGGKRLAA
jgi:hypothetical protein